MRIISYVGYFDIFSPYLLRMRSMSRWARYISSYKSRCFITPTYVDVRKSYLSQTSI
jgi:hypothetical protein